LFALDDLILQHGVGDVAFLGLYDHDFAGGIFFDQIIHLSLSMGERDSVSIPCQEQYQSFVVRKFDGLR
jgi:hypothetical protein